MGYEAVLAGLGGALRSGSDWYNKDMESAADVAYKKAQMTGMEDQRLAAAQDLITKSAAARRTLLQEGMVKEMGQLHKDFVPTDDPIADQATLFKKKLGVLNNYGATAEAEALVKSGYDWLTKVDDQTAEKVAKIIGLEGADLEYLKADRAAKIAKAAKDTRDSNVRTLAAGATEITTDPITGARSIYTAPYRDAAGGAADAAAKRAEAKLEADTKKTYINSININAAKTIKALSDENKELAAMNPADPTIEINKRAIAKATQAAAFDIANITKNNFDPVNNNTVNINTWMEDPKRKVLGWGNITPVGSQQPVAAAPRIGGAPPAGASLPVNPGARTEYLKRQAAALLKR